MRKIHCNVWQLHVIKNGVPFDTEKPAYASGIRLGTPAVTTRGFKENDMRLVASFIDQALRHKDDTEIIDNIRKKVIELTKKYPLYTKGV